MPLTPGTRLGPYEITAQIGVGGMGEVYRATDKNLGRGVAIKVLPEAVAQDAERLARFEREAKTLASLNHPNIAIIHGLERGPAEAGHYVQALVMELVEGPTLAERVATGPLPLDEALTIAKQIAEALEAAHEQGIVHRDLKPANVKVRDDGTVKVLDFGLAKIIDDGPPKGGRYNDGGPAQAGHYSISPTITTPAMTQLGMILGTAAYMAPEQARGKPVDKRSDIWAFGCVLFEMLAGKKAFHGEDVTDTIAAVVRATPDWNRLPAGTPQSIRRLLRRCLEKERRRRLSDIADARLEIDDVLAGADDDSRRVDSIATSSSRWSHPLPWALAAVFGVAFVAAIVLWSPWRGLQPIPGHNLTIELGADVPLRASSAKEIAISPDGKMIAFVGASASGSQLYVRRLDRLEAAALVTGAVSTPFFSPDSQWIAFFGDGKLKKISVAGGSAIAICDVFTTPTRGAFWGDDGYIVFQPAAQRAALLRVSAEGGVPSPATVLGNGEVAHRWPQVLPGARGVLFTATTAFNSIDDAHIAVQPLPSGPEKVVLKNAYHGRYVRSGHLVYAQRGTLFAVPFDIERMEVTGAPVSVVDGVFSSTEGAVSWFDISDNGTLVYAPGQLTVNDVPLEWLGRTGPPTPLPAMPINWAHPQFSPEGRRLAFNTVFGDVYVYDWGRDFMRKVTSDPAQETGPVWSPDGSTLAFASSRADKTILNLFVQAADGSGDAHRLTESTHDQRATSWHPSGKYLLFQETALRPGNVDEPAKAMIMVLPMEKSDSGWKAGTPMPFVNDDNILAVNPVFSPDGRWVAYQSNEAGRLEVFVRPFPGPGSRWQISAGGGIVPTWSRTANQLFFLKDAHLNVVSYTVEGNTFRADPPKRWSEQAIQLRPGQRPFDLHPDGNRFVVSTTTAYSAQPMNRLILVTNFFDKLRSH